MNSLLTPSVPSRPSSPVIQNGSLHSPINEPILSKLPTDCQTYLTDFDLTGGFMDHSYESLDVKPVKRFVSTSQVPPCGA